MVLNISILVNLFFIFILIINRKDVAKKISNSYFNLLNFFSEKNLEHCTEYDIYIDNISSEQEKVTLFGHNCYLLHANFGSSPKTKISVKNKNFNYLQLLFKSQQKPFKSLFLKLKSDSYEQLNQILTVTSKYANGKTIEFPIIPSSYSIRNNSVTIFYPINIDGNTFINFNLLPNAKVSMSFYHGKSIFKFIISRMKKFLTFNM